MVGKLTNRLDFINYIKKSGVSRDTLLRRMMVLDEMISSLGNYLETLALLEDYYSKYPQNKEEIELIRKCVLEVEQG